MTLQNHSMYIINWMKWEKTRCSPAQEFYSSFWFCLHISVQLTVCSIMPLPPDWEALFCWEDVDHWGDDLQLHHRENLSSLKHTHTLTHTHRKTTAVPASMMTNHTSFCQRYSDSKKHPLKMHVQHTLTASNTPPHYLSLLLPHFWGLIWSLFSSLSYTACQFSPRSNKKYHIFWCCVPSSLTCDAL